MTSSNGNIFRVTGPSYGEFTGLREFPSQRPVTRSFDVFFDPRLNKRLSKQSRHRWFETLLHSLWRHSTGAIIIRLPHYQGSNSPRSATAHRLSSRFYLAENFWRPWNIWPHKRYDTHITVNCIPSFSVSRVRSLDKRGDERCVPNSGVPVWSFTSARLGQVRGSDVFVSKYFSFVGGKQGSFWVWIRPMRTGVTM